MEKRPVSQSLYQQQIGREVWVRGVVTGKAHLVEGVRKYEVFFPLAGPSWEKKNGTELLVVAEDVRFSVP